MQRRRHALSITLLGLQGAMAVVHLDSSLVYPTNPSTTALVAYLDAAGPYWLLLFGLSAVWLLVATVRHAGRHWAHLSCTAVWCFYSAGLVWGVVAMPPPGRPVGPLVLPLCTVAVTVIHLVMATVFELEDGRR